MPLVRKDTLYTLAVMAWGVASAGATILIISGNARPWAAPTALPVDGPLTFFGVVAGLWIAGAFVIGRFERRSWRRTGRRANLTPEGGGLFSSPDLVGTVNGRPVRAHLDKRKEGGGGESGPSTVTYTIVEATLSAPVENGLILSQGGDFSELTDVDVAIEGETVGDVTVVGTSTGLARDVVTRRVQDSLGGLTLTNTIMVGDASGVFLEALPDMSGPIMGRIGAKVEAKLEDRAIGGSTTVATESKGTLLSGAELARQIDAVAAVADAYEAAAARRPEV